MNPIHKRRLPLYLAFLLSACTLHAQTGVDNPQVTCPCCSCLNLATAKVSTTHQVGNLATSIDTESTECLRVLEDAEGRLNFTIHLPSAQTPCPECSDAAHPVGLSVSIEHDNGRVDNLGSCTQGQDLPVTLNKWQCGGEMKVRIFCTVNGVIKSQCAEFCVIGGTCGACEGSGTCEPSGTNDSVDFTIPVGTSDFGDVLAYLTAHFDTITNPGPGALRLSSPPEIFVTTTNANVLSTVTTVTAIATVINTPVSDGDANAYTILISCDPGSPSDSVIRRIVIATVGGKLRLTSTYFPSVATFNLGTGQMTGTTSGTDRIMEWDKVTNVDTTWTFTDGNGMAKSVKTISVTQLGLIRTETVEKYDSNILTSRVVTKYQKWGGRWKPNEQTVDPRMGSNQSHANLVTFWQYNDSTSTTADHRGFGQLSEVVRPDGSYETHTYTTSTHTIYRPFGAGSTTTETREWSENTPNSNSSTLTAIIKKGGTQIVSKRQLVYDNSARTIKTLTYYDTNAHHDEITEFYPPYTSGSGIVGIGGKVKQVNHEDGTVSTYAYTQSANRALTVVTGTTTNNITTYTRTSAKGHVVESKTSLIAASGTVDTDYWIVGEVIGTDRDHLGRPLSIKYFPLNTNGPAWTITRSYNCCGLASETDSHGVATFYAYDALKRRIKTNTLNVTNATVYSGPTVSQYRYAEAPGTGGSLGAAITNEISRTVSNLAGDVIQSWGASPQTGALAQLATYTTTYKNPESTSPNNLNVPGPNGSSIVIGKKLVETLMQTGTVTANRETVYLPDGKTYQSTGALSPNIRYDYAANVTSASYLDNGTLRETTVTTTDWAGRTTNVTKGTESTDYAYYDSANDPVGARGKLKSITDADTVRTIYAYNSKGERTTTALKLDGNPGITYGTDQITRTETFPTTRGQSGTAVLRTQTLVWKDNAGETGGTVASYTDRTPDGLRSWREDWPEGIMGHPISTIVINLLGDGAWEELNTRDDGTISVSSYENGKLSSSAEYDSLDVDCLGGFTLHYGDFNRLTSTVDWRTGSTETFYKSDICDVVASVTAWVTTTVGRTTSFKYDHQGRRTEVDAPDTDACGEEIENITNSTYYPDGNLKEVTGDQTYRTSYTYDYAGRMKSMATYRDATPTVTAWIYYPDCGRLWRKRYNSDENGGSGSGPDFTYTLGGRLHTRQWARTVDGDRVTTTYGYTAGRRTDIAYSDGTPSVSFGYDTLGRTRFVHDSSGGQIDYTYDDNRHYEYPESQVVMAEIDDGLEPVTQILTRYQTPESPHQQRGYYVSTPNQDWNYGSYWYWDQLIGRFCWVVTSDMGNFSYDYVNGSQGLVDSVVGPLHKVNNVYEPTRDVLKSKASEDFDSTPNLISKVEYSDPLNQTNAVNDIGQRLKVTFTGNAYTSSIPNDNREGTNDYGYNSKGELQDALRKVPGPNPPHNPVTVGSEHFGYFFDGVGNRTTAEVNGAVVHTYDSNALNQYEEFDYDADGNLADDGVYTYTWDAENRLIAVSLNDETLIAQYYYDPLGRRTRKTTTSDAPQGATQRIFFYDGWNLIAEYQVVNGEVSQLRTYVWGVDLSGTLQGAGGVGGLLEICDYSTETPINYYPLFDGNGNVTQLITDGDTGGAELAAHYEYDPFGNLTRNVDVDSSGFNEVNPFRFSTKYFDEETGFYYYGYRYFDPLTGRWPSRDPIEEEGGINLYGFVENDGISNIDTLGDSMVSQTKPWPRYFVMGFLNAHFKCVCNAKEGPVTPMDVASCDGYTNLGELVTVSVSDSEHNTRGNMFGTVNVVGRKMSDLAEKRMISRCKATGGRCTEVDQEDSQPKFLIGDITKSVAWLYDPEAGRNAMVQIPFVATTFPDLVLPVKPPIHDSQSILDIFWPFNDDWHQ